MNAKPPEFSLRSWDGFFCKQFRWFAAATDLLCNPKYDGPNTDEYDTSKCYRDGVKGKWDIADADAKEILMNEVKKGTGPAKKLVCAISFVPAPIRSAANCSE